MKNWRLHHYLFLMLAMSTFLVSSTCIWYTTADREIKNLFLNRDDTVVLGHIELNGQKVSDKESMRYLTKAIVLGNTVGDLSTSEIDGVGFVSNRMVYAAIKYHGRVSRDRPDVVLTVSDGWESITLVLRIGPDCPVPLRELFERNQPHAAVRRTPAP